MLMRKNGVKNMYELKGDVAYLYVTNKNYSNKSIVFSSEHLDEVRRFKWTINSKGYCISTTKFDQRVIFLHRLVTKCPEDLVVDHINHDTFNNVDDNLRICTDRENSFNKGIRKDNKCGYRGVSFHKASCKWRCELRVDGKKKWIGLYNTPEEAYQARLKAEKEYFGEFRYLEKEKVVPTAIDTTPLNTLQSVPM
jgi:hypothetical protein